MIYNQDNLINIVDLIHIIVNAEAQISEVSGRIINQKVNLL